MFFRTLPPSAISPLNQKVPPPNTRHWLSQSWRVGLVMMLVCFSYGDVHNSLLHHHSMIVGEKTAVSQNRSNFVAHWLIEPRYRTI